MGMLRNFRKPVLKLRHFALKQTGDGWSTECPVCETGVLLIRRNQRSMKLQKADNCVSCGQPVSYLDIKHMRENDPM